MKTRHLNIYATLLSICLFAVFLSAADGQNLVKNGDFEKGWGEGQSRTFDATAQWYNRVGNQKAIAVRNDRNMEGSKHNAIVVDRTHNVTHSQRTDYVIQPGDSFDVYFDWQGNELSWNNRDFIRVVLFATDNDKLNGKVVWQENIDSHTTEFPGSWENTNFPTAVVPQATVGRKLFVNFYGVDPMGTEVGKPSYARVDNLKVTTLPKTNKP